MNTYKIGDKTYILFDERAKSGDTDSASVLDTSDDKPTYTPQGGIWAEVECTEVRNGVPIMEKERLMWEIV